MNKLTDSRIKKIFNHMHDRCYEPSVRNYKSYGAKGVTVCDEWFDYDTFKTWYTSYRGKIPNDVYDILMKFELGC